MNEYEKYQLQWMLEHNHSIREMITRLGEIAFNEMSNDVGLSFDKIMKHLKSLNMSKDLIMKKFGCAKMNGNMIYTVAMNIV